MTLTPELLTSLSVVLNVLLLAGFQFYNSSKVARKDEMTLLRGEVARLQKRVEMLEDDYAKERRNNFTLLDYISLLRSLMVAASIAVPPMPTLE